MASSTVKVLHIMPTIDPASGGPVEGLKQLCNIFSHAGHEIEVATLDSSEFDRRLAFPVKVFALGPGMGTYGYAPAVFSWLRANAHRYDAVVVHGIWQYPAVAVHRALAGTGVPYAVITHGMLDPYFKHRYPFKHIKKMIYWRLILKRIMQDANTVFFTCADEMLLARQSFSHYRVRETVMPFGTFGPDCELAAAREEFLERWPHLRGKRLALYAGRIHPKKGTNILIKAFAATLAKDPAWHLVIAGPDQIGWRKDLQALATGLGIGDRITWTGMLTGSLRWGAFPASEVFVLPSHQENFGMVVAEALACGLPVILSRKVNIWREIVHHWAGIAGEDTVEGTTESLQLWSEHTPEEIEAFGDRARDCFDRHFNLNRTSKSVLQIFENLAESNPQYSPDPVFAPGSK